MIPVDRYLFGSSAQRPAWRNARTWVGRLPNFIGIIALIGCSDEAKQPPPAPTEQEIHANDAAYDDGVAGRHLFACTDGRTLLVDFKEAGTRLFIRSKTDEQPLILAAPTPQLQYVSERASATMRGRELRIEHDDGTRQICLMRVDQGGYDDGRHLLGASAVPKLTA